MTAEQKMRLWEIAADVVSVGGGASKIYNLFTNEYKLTDAEKVHAMALCELLTIK